MIMKLFITNFIVLNFCTGCVLRIKIQQSVIYLCANIIQNIIMQ